VHFAVFSPLRDVSGCVFTFYVRFSVVETHFWQHEKPFLQILRQHNQEQATVNGQFVF